MQTNLQNVPIGAIEVLHNYREVHPPTEKDPDIIELSQDIKANGIYQAIMLRPHPSKKNVFQIIFGHRRFIAAKLAGLHTIPANVREVADDQVLEIQVTENLQRKDCHPMDEAVAYKQLMEKKKYSVTEISDRFAKTTEYILQRLKLNDLVPELQNIFKQDKIIIGQALLICRLTPADQVVVRKAFANDFSSSSVASVKQYIDRNIVQDLSNISWNITDAELLPAAGPCNVCPKRSDTNNLLFKDMAKNNRCMDKSCFQKKADLSFIKNLKETIETHPDAYIVKYHQNHKIPDDIKKLLKDMNVPVITDGVDCSMSSYSIFKAKAKGFFLDGSSKGTIRPIYLKVSKAESAKKTTDSAEKPEIVIAGIKQRTTRAAELDAEKVHARILEDLKKHSTQKEVDAKMKSLPEPEAVAMAYILFELLSYTDNRSVAAKLKLKGFDHYANWSDVKKSAAFYQSLRDISVGDLALIIRKVMLYKHPGTTMLSNKGYIIRKMAESYKDIPVQQYEAEQKEIRDKREKNAAARIAALQPSSLRQRSKESGSKPKKATSLRGRRTKQTVKKK